MDLISKTDEEIREIAAPLWNDLIRHSNNKDYGGFTKDFSKSMLMGASEVELGKQWANNKVLSNLSDENEFLGCLKRNQHVTVLYKQKSNEVEGDFLGRLVLGVEEEKVKIFGATIF